MDLRIHNTRQDMQSFGIERLGGLRIAQGTDGGDAAATNPDIGFGDAVWRSGDPALYQQIKYFRHSEGVRRRSRLGNRKLKDYFRRMTHAMLLEDRSIIAVTGAEARTFLQGLITNDIEKVAHGRAIYAALLTPQGKILFDFLITEGDAAILIDCHRDARDTLIRRLSMYKLRAKIQIEAREQLAVLAGLDGPAAHRGITFEDPRLPALGHRIIGARAEMPEMIPGAQIYTVHRVSLGVPEARDFGSDRMFALDADLDELQAVDFNKGCYVGQELTARMKHRGTARKRLLLIESEAVLPPSGDLRAGGHSVGEIVSTYGARGFALVRLDRLEEAGDTVVEAEGVRVAVTKQPWLSA
ncbi:MAG: hypothetical protein WDM89_17090 [Rhizomicrobium sp.]